MPVNQIVGKSTRSPAVVEGVNRLIGYGRDAKVKTVSILRRTLRNDEIFFSHVTNGAGRLSFNFEPIPLGFKNADLGPRLNLRLRGGGVARVFSERHRTAGDVGGCADRPSFEFPDYLTVRTGGLWSF